MKVIFNPVQMGVTSIAFAVIANSLAMYLIGCFLIGLGMGLIGCKRGGDR